MDLQFPHHENEIAQSEGATGEHFANVWMHNGFVNVDDEKMSKSLGNFFTVRDVLKIYPAEVVRYFILSSHYRSPLNYSDRSWTRPAPGLGASTSPCAICPQRIGAEGQRIPQALRGAMDDDFNTPVAISVLFDLAREVNTLRDTKPAEAPALAALLKELGGLLGLLESDPETYLQAGAEQGDGLPAEEVREAHRGAQGSASQ